MRSVAGFSWSLLVLLLTGLSARAQTVQYPVTGIVLGPSGPVANASVSIVSKDHFRAKIQLSLTRTTDASGKFSAEVPDGFVRVNVSPPAGSNLLAEDSGDIQVATDMDFRFALSVPVRLSLTAVAADRKPMGVTFEVYSISSDRSFTPSNGYPFLKVTTGQTAVLNIQADRYVIHAIPDDPRYSRGLLKVDAQSGLAQDLTITIPLDAGSFLTQDPPRASMIQVSGADDNGIATVSGLAGAVAPSSSLVVINLLTHQANLGLSAADGSFALPVFAPPGSFLQIKHDPTGKFLPHMNFGSGGNDEFQMAPGTIIHLPPEGDLATTISTGAVVPGTDPGDLRYRGWSLVGNTDPGQIWIRGSLTQANWQPAGTSAAKGTLTLYSANLTEATNISAIGVSGQLTLEKIVDEKGRQSQEPNQLFRAT